MAEDLGTAAGIHALRSMCKKHASIWEGLYTDMEKLLADAKRKASENSLQRVLQMEKEALEQIASKANKDGKLLSQVPPALRQQLLETNAALLKSAVHPLLAKLVEAMRRDPECRRSAWNLEGVDFDSNYKPNTCWAAASWHPGSVRPLKHPKLLKLLEVTGGRAGTYKQIVRYLKRLARQSQQESDSPVLRLDAREKEGAEDERKGMPVSRGAEPFLRSIRSSLLLAAVEQGILLPSVVGNWQVDAAWQNNEKQISYKVSLEPGPGGALTGKSFLKNVTEVSAELIGSRLKITQMTADTVYDCVCDVSVDKNRWMHGTWESRKIGSHGTRQFQGTFTASRLGAVRYVDAHLEEWDEMTSCVVAFARLSDGPVRSGEVSDVGAVLKDLVDSRAEDSPKGLAAFAEDLTWLMADPWMWQVLVLILMNWSSQTPQKRRPFQALAAAALHVLHCSAASLDNKKGDILRTPPSEDEFAKLGLNIPDITAALYSISKPKVFVNEHGEACGQTMPYLCHDNSIDADFRPALERAMQHAQGVDGEVKASAVTTLRLLLASMAGRACYLRKSQRLATCMELVAEWHPTEGSDWVLQLFVDWLMNTTYHRHWKLEPYLYEPLVEGFTKMAAKDAMIHFRLLVFLEVWSRATHCGQIRPDYIRKCFHEDLPARGCFEDAHYAWKEHLACLYYVNSYKSDWNPSAEESTALGSRFPVSYLRGCYEQKSSENPQSKSAAVFLRREGEWSVEVPLLPAPPKRRRTSSLRNP